MKMSRHFLLNVLFTLAFQARPELHAGAPDAGSASTLPAYELKIAPEEWTKLQRDPRSDDRHPAKFMAGGKEYSVEIRYRGDWARTWPKKPLKIFFEKDKEFQGQHVLNLNSCWRDPAFIREQLAYQIYAACGVPSPRTRMVKLNLNGQFYGVFLDVEQPDKSFLKRAHLKGAVLYKANSHRWQADESDLGNETAFHAHYEKETHKETDYRDLQSFCHDLAMTTNVAAFFAARVDVDRYVNFLAGSALVQNWDWFSKNHFIVHDSAGSKKWLIVPWDLDRTLGDHWAGPFDAADISLRLGTAAQPAKIGWNKMFNAFWNEPALRKRLLDRLETLLQTEFTKEKLFPVLDRWESEFSVDVALDRQRWPNRTGNDFHAGIAGVKTYIEERRAFLLREIEIERANQTRR
jgi:spore coat protein H